MVNQRIVPVLWISDILLFFFTHSCGKSNVSTTIQTYDYLTMCESFCVVIFCVQL